MKPQKKEGGEIPGIESEIVAGSQGMGFLLSLLISLGLFCLLPLSQFLQSDVLLVRKVEVPAFSPPPPPKTKMEKEIERNLLNNEPPPKLENTEVDLQTSLMDVTLEVGPGDFKAAFSLASFNPAPQDFGKGLVFALHELDRNPSVLKRGILRYPSHLKRKGLEGEVKLLIQIDENGAVKVIEVVSSTHPDFIAASRKAAETSIYEPPKRNNEPVKVQFFLPVRFSLFN